MKRVTLLLVAFLAVLIVSGCGGGSGKSSGSSNETLIIGTTHASPPNAFVNSDTDEPDGVMIDVVKEVADRAGYDLEFETMPFSSLIPSLSSSRINVIAAGMGITDERAESVDFTDPVYTFEEGLVVPKGNPDQVTGLEDLEGSSVGVSSGTFYHDYLVESPIDMDVKAYDTVSEMLLDLTNGRIHAAINDVPVALYLNENNPDYDVEMVDEYEANYLITIGLIVEKDNDELRTEFNEIIAEMKEDGSLDEIHDKWGTGYDE